MSTDQPIPSARRTIDWGLAGTRALFVAFTVTVSAVGLMLYGPTIAWVAFTVVVPAAVIVGLDKVVHALGALHDAQSTARG